MYHFDKGTPKDYQKALKWYKKAAEQGDAGAQFNLAVMYYYGEGTPQNYSQALKWYNKAADKGLVEAQHNLALMYYLPRSRNTTGLYESS